MENPIRIDDLGGFYPLFLVQHPCVYKYNPGKENMDPEDDSHSKAGFFSDPEVCPFSAFLVFLGGNHWWYGRSI